MNPILQKLIRPHYLKMQGYISAGMQVTKDESKIFLNANENPYELPGLEGFNRYPQPQPTALLESYASLYDVRPEHIAATRGADEAISVLTTLFCEPGHDKIIITPPTFGMYGVNAAAMPCVTAHVPLINTGNDFELDADSIIAAAKDSEVKLVYLCSPNNPTGTSFDREIMLSIISALQEHVLVIIDETYIEFATVDSLSNALSDHPNLVILRTLSKSYSLAGMRMGCMLSGDADFIALVRAKGLDAYPLPHASIAAAMHVMQSDIQAQAKANIETLLNERARMEEALKTSDQITKVYKSDANYLLVEMPRASDFIDHCASEKVILRNFSDKPHTENCIRISIGTPDENDRVLALVKNFN